MECVVNENLKYMWDQEEYEGHIFWALKKITTWKGKQKYQTVTVRVDDLDNFKAFLKQIITKG